MKGDYVPYNINLYVKQKKTFVFYSGAFTDTITNEANFLNWGSTDSCQIKASTFPYIFLEVIVIIMRIILNIQQEIIKLKNQLYLLIHKRYMIILMLLIELIKLIMIINCVD